MAEQQSQWEFGPLGKGWTIKNVSSGLYLTVEKGIGAGVPIVASEYPAAWNVQIEHDDPGLVRSADHHPTTIQMLNHIRV